MSETNKPVVLGALKTILTPLKELIKQTDSVALKALKEAQETKAALEDSLVSPDWNQSDPNAADYVKNRTHYDGHVCIEWDGVVGDRQVVLSTGTLVTFRFIKMSGMTPSPESVATGPAKITFSQADRYGTLGPKEVIDFNSGNAVVSDKGWSYVKDNSQGIIVVYEAGYVYTCTRSGLTGIYTFTEPGIYFSYYWTRNTISNACTKLDWGAIVPLDEKYIPDSIARVTDTKTEDDALEMLTEMGIVNPVTNEEDNIFTDEDGNIFIV